MKLKDLPEGAYFTREQFENPFGIFIFQKCEYNRILGLYRCVCDDKTEVYFSGEKIVYTDLIEEDN